MEDLYSEIIIDHYRHPRHKGRYDGATVSVHESNPQCGDTLTLDLIIDEEGAIRDIAYEPQGCAISTAGMSLLSEEVIGKRIDEVAKLTNEEMYTMLGVPISPARVKCALLGIATLRRAIESYNARQ